VNLTKEQQVCIKYYAAFLSRVFAGDESWIYGYDPDKEQQSPQWKMSTLTETEKGETGDMKEIVHKELFLAGQTTNSTYCCDIL
jgi:hypothetical protein